MAKYEDSVEIPASPQDVTHRLYQVLGSLKGADTPQVQGPQVSTSIAMSMMSWGERVSAWVQPGPNACLVTIRSESNFALVDWGRNRKNVEQVRAGILPAPAPGQYPPPGPR